MSPQRVCDLTVLGKYQNFLLLGGDFLAQFAQTMEFAAVSRRISPIAEPLRGVVADLFKPGQKGQDNAAALDAFDLRFQTLGQFIDRLLINRRLAAGQWTKCGHLGFFRQIADDALVGFEAAQNVGPYQSAQRGELVWIFLGAALQERGEILGAAQQAGAKEVKERPQIRKPVLD